MKDTRYIQDSRGSYKSGYTIKLYQHSSESPYYSGSALYTYTDKSDGSYEASITTTVKGTLVVTTPNETVYVPTNWIGRLFQGDNQLTLP